MDRQGRQPAAMKYQLRHAVQFGPPPPVSKSQNSADGFIVLLFHLHAPLCSERTTLTDGDAAGRNGSARRNEVSAALPVRWRSNASSPPTKQPIPEPTDGYILFLFHPHAPLCSERTTLTDIKKLRGTPWDDNVSKRHTITGQEVGFRALHEA
jgi:hypothetical protein